MVTQVTQCVSTTLSTVRSGPMRTEVRTEPNPQVLGSVLCESGPDPYFQVRGPSLSGPDLRVEPGSDLVRTSKWKEISESKVSDASPCHSHITHCSTTTTTTAAAAAATMTKMGTMTAAGATERRRAYIGTLAFSFIFDTDYYYHNNGETRAYKVRSHFLLFLLYLLILITTDSDDAAPVWGSHRHRA